jgi:hypothetical protein
MIFRRPAFAAVIIITISILLPILVGAMAVQSAGLPSEISDKDFWRMIVDFSERGGDFSNENFVSNELQYQDVIPALKVTTRPGGVYIGVGPEQNFTYVSVLQSKLAFVIDIRRQNMLELLMYKALFVMSPNRTDFVSNLFSRVLPVGLDTKATPAVLFAAVDGARADPDLLAKNLQAIKGYMTAHGYQLSNEDVKTIEKVYQAFFRLGPRITYDSGNAAGVGARGFANYSRLMSTTDITGRNSSFLANEENYLYVREMQRKNLIVPLVGDFAGPAVIHNVARYLTERKATVGVFYISNVETYLDDAQKQAFYVNVTTLPVDTSSMFIRHILGNPARGLTWWRPGMSNVSTVAPMTAFINQIKSGRRPTFEEIVRETKDPVEIGGVGR